MPPDSLSLDHVSELIRLALTPAFLIAAVSSMLGVLSSRLARVADNAAYLKLAISDGRYPTATERHVALRNIASRGWFLLAAMALSVVCALLVTFVIALLYVANRGIANLPGTIGLFFVLSIAALAAAMLCVLIEVGYASASARAAVHDLALDLEERTPRGAAAV
jgi:hypothetical protein